MPLINKFFLLLQMIVYFKSVPLFSEECCELKSLGQFLTLMEETEQLIEMNMYSLALPSYIQMSSTLPHLYESLKTDLSLRTAQLQLILGMPEEAISTIENNISLKNTPQNAKTLLDLSYIIHGQPIKSIKSFDENSPLNTILHAIIQHQSGNKKLAIRYLSKIKESEKGLPLSKILQAKIAIENGNYQLAYEALEPLKTKIPNDHALYPELLWMIGISHFYMGNLPQSISHFEEAITGCGSNCKDFYIPCIQWLSSAYLKQCRNKDLPLKEKNRLLIQAEHLITKGIELYSCDMLVIALAKVYFTKNLFFPSEQTLAKCQNILRNNRQFTSENTQKEALLLQAELTTNYEQKEELLAVVTAKENYRNDELLAYGWLLRGSNEQGKAYQENKVERKKHLKLALNHYLTALKAFQQTSNLGILQPLKKIAQVSYELQDVGQLQEVFDHLSENNNQFYNYNEFTYLKSLIATQLYELTTKTVYLETARNILTIDPPADLNDNEKIQRSLLLGKVYFLLDQYNNAEETLSSLSDTLPNSQLMPELLYWAGRAAEKNSSPINSHQTYYKKCYTHYPKSPYAPESFFRMYTYQDYLQGAKDAKKHLEELTELYPQSRFIIDAFFLLGLDCKRDRKTAKGKWITKGNMTKAIDLFQKASTDYERLKQIGILSDDDIAHGNFLDLRASLEIALCNQQIAKDSLGAKKHIYLQYAEEAFLALIDRIKRDYPNKKGQDLLEESLYELGQTYIEAKKYTEAQAILTQIINYYRSLKVTRGYYLSRSWYDLSLITLNSTEDSSLGLSYSEALEYLHRSEECAKGHVLSTDQTIELWIKIAYCHQMRKEYDQAMRYLTKAIDENAVSSLRIKAMYLRSEIYELQGRIELARKQLEATSKKGGVWGEKAKNVLKEKYGYH